VFRNAAVCTSCFEPMEGQCVVNMHTAVFCAYAMVGTNQLRRVTTQKLLTKYVSNSGHKKLTHVCNYTRP
jgi:hypothetical protein